MKEPVIATTTINNEKEAKSIAAALVKKKLAACVQIIPKILSIYTWNDKIHEDQEYLLIIKTHEKTLDTLKQWIKKNHSYEVPEFLVTPVICGLESYLKWMEDVTK